MNTRRQFLIRAPLGVLVAAAACRNDAPSSGTPTASPATPGAPPTFGTGAGSGPAVTPATFAEAEKLMQVTMTPAERQQAADVVAAVARAVPRAAHRTAQGGDRRRPTRRPRSGIRCCPGITSRRRRAIGSCARRPTARRCPSSDDAIAFAPVTQLSRWIESRKLTSERLTNIYLEPHRAARREDPIRHHAHEGSRARAREAGRCRDRRGQVSRPAARHPVRREGSARHEGHPDDLRRRAVPQPRAVGGLRGRAPAERRGRGARREALARRARAQRHLVRRPDDEPVAAGGRRVGIERRARRGDGRRRSSPSRSAARPAAAS